MLFPNPQRVNELAANDLPHDGIAAIQALSIGDIDGQFAGGLLCGAIALQ